MLNIDNKAEQFRKDLIPILEEIKKQMEMSLSNFNIKGGKFLIEDYSSSQLIQFNNSFITSLETSGYNDLVGKYLGDARLHLKDRASEFAKIFPQLGEISPASLDNILKVNATEFSLVSDDIAGRLQTRLTNQVLNGESLVNSIEILNGVLDSDLIRYSETWLRTAYQQYMQKTEDFLGKKIGFGESRDDIWEYVGAPLQSNSHSECIWALRTRATSYFTTKQKEAFQNGTAYVGQPAPPRYNCQHIFIISSHALTKLAREDVKY